MFPDLNKVLIMLGIICALAGWTVIEFILWLMSFITISFGV